MDEADVEADACAARQHALHPVDPHVVGVTAVRPAPHAAHVGEREPLAAKCLAPFALKAHRVSRLAGGKVATCPHVVPRLATAVVVGEESVEFAALLAVHP